MENTNVSSKKSWGVRSFLYHSVWLSCCLERLIMVIFDLYFTVLTSTNSSWVSFPNRRRKKSHKFIAVFLLFQMKTTLKNSANVFKAPLGIMDPFQGTCPAVSRHSNKNSKQTALLSSPICSFL